MAAESDASPERFSPAPAVPPAQAAAPAPQRFWPVVVVVAAALQLSAVASLVTGADTLYLRDVLNTHLVLKEGVAAALRHGELAAVDLLRGGQPITGNPNALPFYPDNLMYLVAPSLWALNAHFWIHFLLAPWAFFWLGRRLGVSPAAAFAGGVAFACSGFFLSQMSFYNLVAGATLTPAFLAACHGAASGGRRHAVAAGALWALLLLAGDPLTAVLALMAAGGLVLWARGSQTSPSPAGVARLLAAGVLGTLIASPQIVELLRILPATYRGFQGFDLEQRLLASWHPVQALEWLIPFFFGPFDQLGRFWGAQHFNERIPYFLTLHPGVVGLALALAAGWRGRLARLGWAAIGAGLFVALGGHNPLLVPLLDFPGASVLRFPVRAFLWVALGGSLLVAATCQGALIEGLPGRRRSAVVALSAIGLLLLVLFAFLRLGVDLGLAGLMPDGLRGDLVAAEQRRWAQLAAAGAAACLLALLGMKVGKGRPVLGIAALLAIHAGGQLTWLRPALARDRAEHYRERPALLAPLAAGTRVAATATGDLFGSSTLGGGHFPDASAYWLPRRAAAELYPFVGVRWGLSYDLYVTPEGLDSYLAWLATSALRDQDDLDRIRLLRTWGLEAFVLSRPLEAGAAAAVRPLASVRHFGHEARLYGIEGVPPPVRWVAGVRWAADPRRAVVAMLDPRFDPATEVVLAGSGAPATPKGGELLVLAMSTHEIVVETSGDLPGVVVVERAHLPIYRAAVGDHEVPVRAANLFRIGVEVPAGTHRVRLWVDRRPLRRALAAAAVGLVMLPLLALPYRPRRRGKIPAPS